MIRTQLVFRPWNHHSKKAPVIVGGLGRSCVFGQLARLAWKSTVARTAADADTTQGPALTTIPTLPFFGSFVTDYSNTPKYEPSTILEFWPEMKNRFGDFYRMGMPGIGSGLHGYLHVIQDPKEMVKLLRKDDHQYPAGTTEFVWPPRVHADRYHNPAIALIDKGPEWKRFRNFAQTDLLAPKSAARYLPAALEAAKHSSKGISHAMKENTVSINEYLNLASFEMFCNIMLGHLPNITDPDVPIDPEDKEFCEVVAVALRTSNILSQSTYHKFMVNNLGIDTDMFKKYMKNQTRTIDISRKMVSRLKKLRDTRPEEMTQKQKNSYANQAFERQLTDDSITVQEAESLVGGLIAAGVDTTGNMLTWRLLHIAMHPEIQEKLYQELIQHVDQTTGYLTEESISQTAKTPYLHACMRESHRCGNAAPTIPIKRFEAPVEVHGVLLPAGSVILLDAYSTGMNTDFVEDPLEYRPERFLKAAVEARKGTPAEIIDHAFFSGPFSQGVRRCPGSRVANLEAHAFMAQLVLDWKMSIPSLKHWTDCPYGQDTLTVARLPKVEFTPRK